MRTGRIPPQSFHEQALARLVERIRRVPDQYRDFRNLATQAAWQHGIDTALLGTLTALGLPSRGVGEDARYDQLDLVNVSLSLSLPSARLMAMRGWAAAIRAAGKTSVDTTYVVAVVPSCPRARHDAGCRTEASAQLRSQSGFAVSPDGLFTVARQVRGQSPQVHPDVAELTSQVATVHFHQLPRPLRHDVGFLREARLADCSLAATFLAAEAQAMGLQARRSFGLFLSAPYSMAHSWFELHIGRRWVPFDPHLLNLLTRLSLLRETDWPPYRSIGDGAWRLAESEFVMATHDQSETQLSFPTHATASNPPT